MYFKCRLLLLLLELLLLLLELLLLLLRLLELLLLLLPASEQPKRKIPSNRREGIA